MFHCGELRGLLLKIDGSGMKLSQTKSIGFKSHQRDKKHKVQEPPEGRSPKGLRLVVQCSHRPHSFCLPPPMCASDSHCRGETKLNRAPHQSALLLPDSHRWTPGNQAGSQGNHQPCGHPSEAKHFLKTPCQARPTRTEGP